MTTSAHFTFFLGTHRASHLATAGVPLFVSHRTLRGRKTLPRAIAPWALDSGGFTELSLHGEWKETPEEYVAAIRRYVKEIGMLEFAAPQDWMAEGFMTAKTGMTVADHQRLTVQNFLKLRALAPELPIIPVLQGWWDHDFMTREEGDVPSEGSYEDHMAMYAAAGVDLTKEKLIGLGSVCRKGKVGIGFLHNIARQLAPLMNAGVRFHAFGFKAEGLHQLDVLTETENYHAFPGVPTSQPFASADSLAWSMDARKTRGMTKGQPLPGCTHKGKCNNCLAYALKWRSHILAGVPALMSTPVVVQDLRPVAPVASSPAAQLSLF